MVNINFRIFKRVLVMKLVVLTIVNVFILSFSGFAQQDDIDICLNKCDRKTERYYNRYCEPVLESIRAEASSRSVEDLNTIEIRIKELREQLTSCLNDRNVIFETCSEKCFED